MYNLFIQYYIILNKYNKTLFSSEDNPIKKKNKNNLNKVFKKNFLKCYINKI